MSENRVPPFRQFEVEAHREFDEVPPRYREGIEALRVRRPALPHPTLADVYTLGECRVVEWATPIGELAEIRSEVILYHGSFQRLAELDPEFDWRGELWETITHEIQHHLEFRAEVATLEERDYADDQNFRRGAGERFDPTFYRSGEPVEPGVYRVGDDWFVEGRWDEKGDAIAFGWRGVTCRVRPDGPRGRATYIRPLGLEAGPGELWVVAVSGGELSTWIRALLGRPVPPPIVEYEADPECGPDE